MSVITSVARDIAALGLETKELFLLGEVEAHPYPAELAAVLGIPRRRSDGDRSATETQRT